MEAIVSEPVYYVAETKTQFGNLPSGVCVCVCGLASCQWFYRLAPTPLHILIEQRKLQVYRDVFWHFDLQCTCKWSRATPCWSFGVARWVHRCKWGVGSISKKVIQVLLNSTHLTFRELYFFLNLIKCMLNLWWITWKLFETSKFCEKSALVGGRFRILKTTTTKKTFNDTTK